jgi:hypothetical protein
VLLCITTRQSDVQFKPWVSQGSEAEMAAEAIVATRAACALTLERPRRAFCRETVFADKDAQEIHAMSSAHMELRPYKDADYSIRRALLDAPVQAAAATADAAVQARSRSQITMTAAAKALIKMQVSIHCS